MTSPHAKAGLSDSRLSCYMQVWLVILMIGTLLGSIVQVGHFILAVSHLLLVAEADLSGGIQGPPV